MNNLQICIDRAMKYLDQGMVKEAVAFFASDITKHEDTKKHVEFVLMAKLSGELNSEEKVRKFLNGFNL